MLLNFTVANWMSYRDESSLSLMSTRERQHGDTRAKLPRFRSKKVLPIAAVYGGNASGKTALFQALAALRQMVVSDPGVDGLLPARPFSLDDDHPTMPTRFDLTFLADETVFRLIVEATSDHVSYESLEMITEHDEVLVYERDEAQEKPYDFGRGFFEDEEHVAYAAKSTRPNQLFLQSGVAQNIQELLRAYQWFTGTLELVGVQSQSWSFAKAIEKHEGFLSFAGKTLARLDTGIVALQGEDVSLDALPRDAALRRSVAGLQDNQVITIVMEGASGDYQFDMLSARKEGSRVAVQRLKTVHEGADGKRHLFNVSEESSGTQRLLGLLPMLFDFAEGNSKVYVVDELDRCLHTMLTKQLIEEFADGCGPSTRKQLLFTTHDLLLMDQDTLRRDETYISQRDRFGASELIGLSEFKDIRYDKDLIRSYLDGRFGGVPMLGGAGDYD